MPDEATRQVRLRRFFELELRHVAFRSGSVWTSRELGGAALCLPPGAWCVPTRVLFALGTSFCTGVRRSPAESGGASVRDRARPPA
jgi:hypothetical protein